MEIVPNKIKKTKVLDDTTHQFVGAEIDKNSTDLLARDLASNSGIGPFLPPFDTPDSEDHELYGDE